MASIQLTFRDDPYTIGSPQIDYCLGDPIASPPEFAAAAFTERLVLLPHPYLISSYASWQPKVLTMKRIDKSSITNYLSLPPQQRKQWQDTVLFGSFHGPTKIDPTIFHVWMNILRNVPRGYLVLFGGDKYREANTNRLNYARHYGLNIDQINFLRVAKWDEHLHMKSAFDLFLDTIVKNGHTTTVDAAYAGVPIVGLGSRVPVSGRSTASVTHYLGADQGIVYSLKEYEDMVTMLSKSRYGAQVLKGWRREGELARKRSTVFDIDFQTRSLVDAFEAMVDIGVVVNRSSASFQYRTRRYPYSEWGGFSHFHMFASFARDP